MMSLTSDVIRKRQSDIYIRTYAPDSWQQHHLFGLVGEVFFRTRMLLKLAKKYQLSLTLQINLANRGVLNSIFGVFGHGRSFETHNKHPAASASIYSPFSGRRPIALCCAEGKAIPTYYTPISPLSKSTRPQSLESKGCFRLNTIQRA